MRRWMIFSGGGGGVGVREWVGGGSPAAPPTGRVGRLTHITRLASCTHQPQQQVSQAAAALLVASLLQLAGCACCCWRNEEEEEKKRGLVR